MPSLKYCYRQWLSHGIERGRRYLVAASREHTNLESVLTNDAIVYEILLLILLPQIHQIRLLCGNGCSIKDPVEYYTAYTLYSG